MCRAFKEIKKQQIYVYILFTEKKTANYYTQTWNCYAD